MLVTLLFWCYAIVLVLVARTFAHQWLEGWAARLATMGIVAMGLVIPWGRWLQPRLLWCLGWCGRILFIGLYLLILWPFALMARLGSTSFRLCQRDGSWWQPRRPLPEALDAFRLDY